jgi:hypothetical protein
VSATTVVYCFNDSSKVIGFSSLHLSHATFQFKSAKTRLPIFLLTNGLALSDFAHELI